MGNRPYQPTANQNAQAGNRVTFSGDYDPRVLLTPALRGAVFFRLDKGNSAPLEIFRKLDNDTSSFNWEIITGSLPGPPGPVGPPGPIGPPANSYDIFDCDISTSIGDFVYVSGSNTVAPAIANDIVKKFAIGLVIGKPTPTIAEVLSIKKTPSIFTGLTPNLPVFLSATTLGGFTQTPPTGGNRWLQILGVATSASEMILHIQEPKRRI